MQFFSKKMFSLLSLVSTYALADDSNQFSYFGLNLQHNSYQHIQFSPTSNPAKLTPLSYGENLSDKGLRGFVGHQFNRYFALEVGAGSYGEAGFQVTREQTGSDGKPLYTTVVDGGFKTFAGDLRAVGTYPFNDHLFLKAQLGALFWNNEFTRLTGTTAVPEIQKTSANGVSLISGLGVGYGFNNKIAVAIDFERTKIASIQTQNVSLSFLVRL